MISLRELLPINERNKVFLRVPNDIKKIYKLFKKNKKQLYIVGGAVRDAILGKSPKDYDMATDATPDEVLAIAKKGGFKTLEIGKSFGVVVVGGHEIATFRKDIGKGRRPDAVDFTDIQGDIKRRDLTVNALFYDIGREEIVDLVGGLEDLKKKLVKTVGQAELRFDEDPLRKLRALRFNAALGGTMHADTFAALKKNPSLNGVSSERIREEFVKSITKAKSPKKYMELCDKLGFTKQILPGLDVSKPYVNENDDIYYWYKIKKKASIISNELGTEESLNFINSKFKKIKNPSLKILFDMANITKGFEEYETSIVYYNKVLSKISLNSESRAEILYRRGSCYERLGQFEKSDKDLLNSLEINPNDAYVLNYLAYSWLERNYKIDTSITMLEKAYKQKKNDPYILDSVGWAYYLVGDLIKAEQFLRKSIKIMPDDPIVNDHYGDILWAMNRKTQAKYYWQSVLNFENTEDDMKEKINIKLLKGPKKI